MKDDLESRFKSGSVSIGLVNPKSPTNVGSVMRAAGCYQVDEVYYTGERYERGARFQTDTQAARRKIALMGVDDLLDVVPDGASVVCVELVKGAIPLPSYQHPENAFYIFGPEDGNLRQSLVDKADAVVYVPTIGCMNLAATVNVLLYDRLAKSGSELSGDELIAESRDCRNNLSVPSK